MGPEAAPRLAECQVTRRLGWWGFSQRYAAGDLGIATVLTAITTSAGNFCAVRSSSATLIPQRFNGMARRSRLSNSSAAASKICASSTEAFGLAAIEISSTIHCSSDMRVDAASAMSYSWVLSGQCMTISGMIRTSHDSMVGNTWKVQHWSSSETTSSAAMEGEMAARAAAMVSASKPRLKRWRAYR